MGMENFALRAYLETPVIVRNGWLTLDGILAALLYRETGSLETAHVGIPLDRKAGVWCGSAAFFEKMAPGNQYCGFQRGLKLDDLDLERCRYLPPGGPRSAFPYWIDQARSEASHEWRSAIDEYPVVEAESVVWFGRGDISLIEALIGFEEAHRKLHAVGSRINHGWGRVRSFEFIPEDDDFSLVMPNGAPARPVPADEWAALSGKEAVLRPERIVPPYWDGEMVLCAVPETRRLEAE